MLGAKRLLWKADGQMAAGGSLVSQRYGPSSLLAMKCISVKAQGGSEKEIKKKLRKKEEKSQVTVPGDCTVNQGRYKMMTTEPKKTKKMTKRQTKQKMKKKKKKKKKMIKKRKLATERGIEIMRLLEKRNRKKKI